MLMTDCRNLLIDLKKIKEKRKEGDEGTLYYEFSQGFLSIRMFSGAVSIVSLVWGVHGPFYSERR